MRTTFLSRHEVRYFLSGEPYVLISCRDPESEPAKLARDHNRKGLLELVFHDIDQPHKLYTCFNAQQAQQVIDFVARWPGIPLIAVHCEAGISRSSGMATALAEAYGRKLIGPLERAVPNRLVYRLIMKAAIGEGTEPVSAFGTVEL